MRIFDMRLIQAQDCFFYLLEDLVAQEVPEVLEAQ